MENTVHRTTGVSVTSSPLPQPSVSGQHIDPAAKERMERAIALAMMGGRENQSVGSQVEEQVFLRIDNAVALIARAAAIAANQFGGGNGETGYVGGGATPNMVQNQQRANNR